MDPMKNHEGYHDSLRSGPERCQKDQEREGQSVTIPYLQIGRDPDVSGMCTGVCTAPVVILK